MRGAPEHVDSHLDPDLGNGVFWPGHDLDRQVAETAAAQLMGMGGLP